MKVPKIQIKDRFTATQYGVLALVLSMFLVFTISYVWSLSEVAYQMQYNTQIAKNEASAIAVDEYTITTDGKVTGTKSDGSSFETTVDKMVLVKETTNNKAFLTYDGVLICQPNASFAKNFLIGSKMLLVLVTATILVVVLELTRNKEKLIYSKKPWVRRSVQAMLVAQYVLVVLTHLVVA